MLIPKAKPKRSWKPRRKVMIAALAALVTSILVAIGVDSESAVEWGGIIAAIWGPVILAYLVPGEALAQPADSLPPPADPKDSAAWTS